MKREYEDLAQAILEAAGRTARNVAPVIERFRVVKAAPLRLDGIDSDVIIDERDDDVEVYGETGSIEVGDVLPVIRDGTGTYIVQAPGGGNGGGDTGGPVPTIVHAKAIRVADFTVSNSQPASATVPFDSVEFSEPVGIVNPAAGIFTIPEDGTYLAVAQWCPGTSPVASPATSVDLIIDLAGVRVGEARRTFTTAPAQGIMVNCAAEFRATAGQALTMKVGCNKGGTVLNGVGSAGLPTYLAIAKLGGPRGEPGTPGGDDLHYFHTQGAALDAWVIPHNLGKYPSVTALDSAREQIEGEVDYPDMNTVVVTFTGPISGYATLN